MKAGATISGAAAGSGAEAGASAGGAVSGSSAAWKPRESPEVQLLLLCARSKMSAEAEQRVRALAADPLDWNYLLRLTMRHGMGPLLHHHTSRVCPAQVPPEITQHLREFTKKSRAWNDYVAEEGARAYAVLRDAGIRAVAYRELTLGARLSYGPVTLRQMECADLLIAPADAGRAKQVLLQAGYSAPPQRGSIAEPLNPPSYQWFGCGDRVALLVYWGLARAHYGIEYDFQAIAERARPMPFAGHQVPALCPEDMALLTCIFGAEYVWQSLEWLADLDETIAGELDWQALEAEAKRIHAQRILRLGVFLANDLLGPAITGEVLSRAARDSAVRQTGEEVIDRMLNSAPATLDSLYTSRLGFRLRDTAWLRVRYAWRMLTLPTDADWRFVRLPQGLFLLYGVLRPVRLMWRALELGAWEPLRRALGWQHRFSGYVSSAIPVVKRMLELAELGPDDVLYDLGCGDGRIVIEAARRYGVRAVGVDIDPQRIAESRANARDAGVESLVEFKRGDAMEVDVSPASVVTLYLPTRANIRLGEKLGRELRPGARVVSHATDVGKWNRVVVADNGGCPALLYVWKVEPGQ